MRTLVRMAALAGAALAAGLAVNQLHPGGIHRNMLSAAFTADHRWRRIQADSAHALFSDGSAVFVDIRPGKEYEADHIPGAESQPFHSFFSNFQRFEKAHPKTGVYVFYCFEPACSEGQLMLAWMGRRGYGKAVWMYGGLGRWIEAGYPVEGGG